MKMLNLKWILTLLLSYNSLSYSKTLLLPEPNYDFNIYLAKCQKEGFICTHDYFLSEALNKPTPQFDVLINSIDLSSDIFIQNFSKKIALIINTEMISLDQLDMILKLIEQVKPLLVNKIQIEFIESELIYLKNTLLESPNMSVHNEFVIVFKKPVSPSFFKKLKTILVKPFSLLIQYDKVPQTANSLFSGDCETAKINEAITIEHWQTLSIKSCSISESIKNTTNHLINKVDENKNSLLLGALAVGAILYLNKYEISFQF